MNSPPSIIPGSNVTCFPSAETLAFVDGAIYANMLIKHTSASASFGSIFKIYTDFPDSIEIDNIARRLSAD